MARCPTSPRWDRTPCPEAPQLQGPREGLAPACPLPTTVLGCPKSSKAPKPPSALAQDTVSHGGDSVLAPAWSQGMLKDRNRRRSQALALGDTLVPAWGHPNQSHPAVVWGRGGTGDVGTGMVTPRCPRGGHSHLTPLLLRWPRGHGKGCVRGRGEGHPAPVPSRRRRDGDEPPQSTG